MWGPGIFGCIFINKRAVAVSRSDLCSVCTVTSSTRALLGYNGCDRRPCRIGTIAAWRGTASAENALEIFDATVSCKTNECCCQ